MHWELLNVVVSDEYLTKETLRMFAMGLGISQKEIDEIISTGPGWKHELQKILWAWLTGKGHPPKWELLVEVLRAPVMGGAWAAAAADRVEQKYCMSSAKHDTLTAGGEC